MAVKKILLINTHHNKGGAAVACRRLSEALQEKDDLKIHHLVHYTDQSVAANDEYTAVTNRKIAFARIYLERLLFLPYEKNKDIRFNFSPANVGCNITNQTSIKDADILHLHWIQHGFISLKGLQKIFASGKPVVWTLHDMWMFTGGCHHSRGCTNYMTNCGDCKFLKSPAKNDLSNRIASFKKKIFANANLKIVTPSSWLAKCALESNLFKPNQIHVIPNPLNLNLYTPTSKTAAKKRLGLNPSKRYLSFIAANVSTFYKGISYLKDALKILQQDQKFNDIELIVIGQLKNEGYEEVFQKVHLTGYITDENKMVDYYNASDVFVLPSLEENLPNTIMEAMACGTPAVAFNTGGIPDLIDHHKNGYLAEYCNATDFAEGIKWVLADKVRYDSLCKNAHEKTVALFSYPIIAKQYKEVYESF